MKILPHDYVTTGLDESIAGLKVNPSVGDTGHVEDHARLAKILLEVPHNNVMIGSAMKTGGAWQIFYSPANNATPSPATFAQVKEFIERVGVSAVAGDPHPSVNGVTEITEDSAALDGLILYAFAAGAVGLTHGLSDLLDRVNTLEAKP